MVPMTPTETPLKKPAVVPLTPAEKVAHMNAETAQRHADILERRGEWEKEASERSLKLQEEQTKLQMEALEERKLQTQLHQKTVDLAGNQQAIISYQQETIHALAIRALSQQPAESVEVSQAKAPVDKKRVEVSHVKPPIEKKDVQVSQSKPPGKKKNVQMSHVKPPGKKKTNVGRRVRIVKPDDQERNGKEGTVSSNNGCVMLDGSDKSFIPGKGNYIYLD
jgi:hypothetical protein